MEDLVEQIEEIEEIIEVTPEKQYENIFRGAFKDDTMFPDETK